MLAGTLVLFLLPFAFTTPPPVVTLFRSTRAFSPGHGGARPQAVIALRLHEAANVTLKVRDLSTGRLVRIIAASQRMARGWHTVTWDGRGDGGTRLPDGPYSVELRSHAGEKQWNASRRVVVDTAAPALRTFEVSSAALAGAGHGECRTRLVSPDDATARIDAVAGSRAHYRVAGPTPIRPSRTAQWSWSGRAVPAGLYRIRATLTDAAGNARIVERTCWVGHAVGRTVPRRPRAGATVAVRLVGVDGVALPASTPVTVTVRRRRGTPGRGAGTPLGASIGRTVSGRMGALRIALPAGVPPGRLWLVVRTRGGVAALVPPEAR